MDRSSTVYNSPKQFKINILVDFDVRGQQGMDISLEEALLCIMDYIYGIWYFGRSDSLKFKRLDGFVSNKHAFHSIRC